MSETVTLIYTGQRNRDFTIRFGETAYYVRVNRDVVGGGTLTVPSDVAAHILASDPEHWEAAKSYPPAKSERRKPAEDDEDQTSLSEPQSGFQSGEARPRK